MDRLGYIVPKHLDLTECDLSFHSNWLVITTSDGKKFLSNVVACSESQVSSPGVAVWTRDSIMTLKSSATCS